MFNNKQARLVHQLSTKEIILNLYLTQLLLVILTAIFSYILYRDILYFKNFLSIETNAIFGLVFGSALIIISMDLIMWKLLPFEWMNDEGINNKIFTSLTVPQIILVTFVIACCEEIFFRGTLQPRFGLFVTSVLFAVIHIRYLAKPILLISALIISFYFGWIFELTHNLYITIMIHFIIDLVLGLILHYKPFAFLRKNHFDR